MDESTQARGLYEIRFGGDAEGFTIAGIGSGEVLCEHWPATASPTIKANARLIVRAVNAHEKLLRATRFALGTIGNECFCADSGAGDLRVCRHCVTRSELRAALALAEQE